jgi:hypothetical protein
MKQWGYWKPETPFVPTLLRFFDESFPGVDDRSHLAELFQMFESETVDNSKVDLKDVAIIKGACDIFFHREIRVSETEVPRPRQKARPRGDSLLRSPGYLCDS